MDAFEARVQFLKIIQRLNGSNTSNNVAASFMLRDPELEDELYNCFMEETVAPSLNTKINILFLVDTLCGLLKQRNLMEHNYKKWLDKDLPAIIDNVVPKTRLGAVNLAGAKDAVRSIHAKQVLNPEVTENILNQLDVFKVEDNAFIEWSKDDILRRMNEDRERAKRHKENIWEVDYSWSNLEEFDRLWVHQGPLEDLDYEQMREDNEIVQDSIRSLDSRDSARNHTANESK